MSEERDERITALTEKIRTFLAHETSNDNPFITYCLTVVRTMALLCRDESKACGYCTLRYGFGRSLLSGHETFCMFSVAAIDEALTDVSRDRADVYAACIVGRFAEVHSVDELLTALVMVLTDYAQQLRENIEVMDGCCVSCLLELSDESMKRGHDKEKCLRVIEGL